MAKSIFVYLNQAQYLLNLLLCYLLPYYVLLTGSTGETAEVPVNVASSPVDESLINLA